MATLYFDCFSGASGDMILGALLDAGVPLEAVRGALGSLAIEPDTIWTSRVQRAGIAATQLHVRGEQVDRRNSDGFGGVRHDAGSTISHSHPHGDAPYPSGPLSGGPRSDTASLDAVRSRTANRTAVVDPEAPHRRLSEIEALVETSALSDTGKARVKRLFHRLASVEAELHGLPIDEVHLHEVGALDSIIDIVGSVFALEWLQVTHAVASPLNLGGGMIRTAHGLYPVPAPATLRLLTDVPVYSGPQQVELVTPTGALLVTEYATSFGGLPPMRVQRTGYGAGARDLADTPNVLRVIVGDADARAQAQTVVLLECEIDDMNPQIFGVLMERLLAQGALDVFYTAVQMKKNRPGTLLTVVAEPAAKDRLAAIVFSETTTIGIRFREMQRECLERETVSVDTRFGPVRVKVARRDGRLVNIAPEFDDCVRLAAAHDRPVKELQAIALKAFLDR